MTDTASAITKRREKWASLTFRLLMAGLLISGTVMVYQNWEHERSIPTRSYNETLALLADGVIDYCDGDEMVSACGSVFISTDFLNRMPWIIDEQGGVETLEGLGAAMAVDVARRIDFTSCDGIDKTTKRQECIRSTVAAYKADRDVFGEAQARGSFGLAF